MSNKPTILFLALIPRGYSTLGVAPYGPQYTFDLMSHKLAVPALIAWLREHGCEGYYVWSERGETEAVETFSKAIEDIKPHALGFSLVTEEFAAHYRVIEELKRRFPEVPVITGGPHVTALPEHTLRRFPKVDFVVVGEGERTLEELLPRIAEGKGKGCLLYTSDAADE